MATAPYSHVQKSPLRYALPVVIAVSLLAAWYFQAELWVWFSMVCVAGVMALILLTITTLTIQGEAESLLVQFGPLPLFSMRVPYDDIHEVHQGRSRVVDGWGIHFIPGRGWTWNLWGFECVDVTRSSGLLRIGSDDAQNLAGYLESQIRKDHAR